MITEESIRKKLMRDCPFLAAWQKTDKTGKSTSEMGYIRAYHRYGWSDCFFVHNEDLCAKASFLELRDIAKQLYRAFPTLDSLHTFCAINAEDLRNGREYNLFMEGKVANYWIRVNITPGDYNLYIHSIIKEAS